MHPRTRIQSKEIARLILSFLGTGTLVTVTSLLSGGYNTHKLLIGFHQFACWRIRRALNRLKIQGLIKFDSSDFDRPIVLTRGGLRRVRETELRLSARQKFKRWDHLWRMVIFDIPERIGVRLHFQRRLIEFGWYCFQESIYVHPQEEQVKIVKKLAELIGAERYVVILVVPDLGPFENKVKEFFLSQKTDEKSL